MLMLVRFIGIMVCVFAVRAVAVGAARGFDGGGVGGIAEGKLPGVLVVDDNSRAVTAAQVSGGSSTAVPCRRTYRTISRDSAGW